MLNWYTVAPPHDDIKQGHFDESVFAAKLGDVVSGDAPPSYDDPYAFFRSTYLTKGLKNLLQRVHRKLSTGQGAGVLQLKTPFGGGKTHALILTYHYLTSGERVSELLPDSVQPLSANVSTTVGTDANPLEGFEHDGVHCRTLWGEIAYQLGGEETYSDVENNDQSRIAPGADLFKEILEPLQPFTILLDEVLEYIVRARGIEVTDSTLGSQTRSFINELAEAVSKIDRGVLLATLPSSEQEDFGERKEHNLAKLQKAYDRSNSVETPVQGKEIYSIIRSRLFESPDEAKVRSVVDRYLKMYHKNEGDLPSSATDGEYREKMELAYPFHPEVIDILYEKWSTFSSFQRTRGALSLLALVVEDLYQREESIDLILPGDVNLSKPAVRQKFLRHIGGEYEGIIDSDIAGDNAKSQRLDDENKSWGHMAQRNATSIFLHSFAADQSEQGIELPQIRLDVSRPDTPIPMVANVLHEQRNELWYLNNEGQAYYFSNVPNLNRVVIDKKNQVQRPRIRKELKTYIQKELGNKLSTYLWPSSGDEIPDNTELKLAVLDPDETYQDRDLRRWVDKKGQSYRTYKNTIIFAVPNSDRHLRFEDEIKDYLALQDIADGIAKGEQSVLEEQQEEVKRRIDDLTDEFPRKVREMYQIAKVPVMNGDSLEEIDFGDPPVGRENLDTWFRRKLASQMHGKILSGPPSARLLQSKFLRTQDEIALSDILDQFYRNPDLPALDDADLIAETVTNGVRDGSFGLARQEGGETVPKSVKIREPLSRSQVNFREEGWVVITADRAEELQAQVETESDDEEEPEDESTDETSGSEDEQDSTSDDEQQDEEESEDDEPPEEEEEDTVQHLSLRVSGVPTGKISDLNRGVLMPIIRAAGQFEFTIEFDVESEEGIPEKKIEQQVMETLRQLGAEVERQNTE